MSRQHPRNDGALQKPGQHCEESRNGRRAVELAKGEGGRLAADGCPRSVIDTLEDIPYGYAGYPCRIAMPLYVKDAQVDALAEQLAAIKGTSKTEAVRQALQNEIAREKGKPDLVEQSIAFARELRERAGPRQGQPVDKAFVDGLYEAG